MKSTLTRENTGEKWTDENHSFDADDRTAHSRNETMEDLAELNPVRMKPVDCGCEMVVSQAAAERGYSRITVGMDQQFALMSSADGGFLGRPQGWER